MKKILISFFLLFVINNIYAEEIFVASFNTMRLGESKKNYHTLAKILKSFDIIALQEVMNNNGMIKLENSLEELTNEDWDYYIPKEPVGTKKYKEYYAFIYKKDKFSEIKPLSYYKNGKSSFIREPFAIKVKAKNFDFILITAHSIYGKNIKERAIEASNYIDVILYFKEMEKDEDDIILLGDFNLPAKDKAFSNLGKINMRPIIDSDKYSTTFSKTGLANPYDNIFINNIKEFTGKYNVYDYSINNNYADIRKYISDHAIVYAVFEDKDLDKNEK